MELSSLFPHGPEIVAIKKIIELKANYIRCLAIGQGSIFNCIEYVAQASALGKISNAEKHEIKLGMILRIKEFNTYSDNSPEKVIVDCYWTDSVNGAYEVKGQVFCESEQLLAQTTMFLLEFE